ncbi:putative metal-dependent amidohydrolase [Erythrobacter dokdonensis DSW-74]|uniref:Putative metal-dependent amidohydrolase n=2 Tax=Erythrobacter TaxID=1041 RepID=A0A1A7BF97_9SPHN|nr:amidohydrolase [Erythrobacter dokdonensis]OBV10082.1 putative metal-dependent amidohydrolase [Erythrobacter dokdonensis DSW-74]
MLRLTLRAVLATSLLALAAPALADTLVDNVDGVTIDAEGKVLRFTGLVFDDDGKVVQVLARGEERPRVDYRLDGEGRVMLPGMIDAHVHVMDIGFAALTLDLSDTTSLEDALARIRTFAGENPGRPWILGRGWNQEKWGLGRFPTAAELDAVVADRPVWLERADNHAKWANSLAIQTAGVTAKTPDPAGGKVIRDARGNPSGVFVDKAMALIEEVVPPPRPEDRDLAFAKAQEVLLGYGVTAVADMGTEMADWTTFRRAGDAGRLQIRIMAYADGFETLELVAGSGPSRWLYDDRLRMGGIKLYLDGALGSRGASLKEPYHDDPGAKGLPLLTPAQLRNLMSRAAMDNFQTAVHAIGDAANAEVLAAVEELAETYDGDRRWRIEHAQIVDPADLPLLGKHGVIASMQPLHQTSDRLMAEVRLGPDRLEGAYPWRSVLKVGGRLAFGSDAPVEPADPFAGMAAAISRTDAKGEPFGGWLPQETVSRETALAGFTADAAFAGFAEGRFGRLVPGERADFLLVDRDPLFASPDEIRQTKIMQVWIGGVRVRGE